jgi:hypothetical protein
MSTPLPIGDLFARLAAVAAEQDGSQSPDRDFLRRPAKLFESTSTLTDDGNFEDWEASMHQGLIESGGRPVCSAQDLPPLLESPTANYEAVLPWLTKHRGSYNWEGQIETVLSRQFSRWWEFRKSQYANRGIDDSEGVSAYSEARRNDMERIGQHRTASDPGFAEHMRRMWESIRIYRQQPDDRGFQAFSNAVKRRLAPHHFTRPLRLKKNPYEQDTWTNWLEYINFEQWWLERLTDVMESMMEEHHRQPWKRLLDARACSEREADLETTNKEIDDFIRDTERYRTAESAVYFQKLRVKWAVEEARLMNTEISEQRQTAKGNMNIDIKGKKKRRGGDNTEITLEQQEVQAEQVGRNGTTQDVPLGPRRSKRLAKLKIKD